MKSNFKTCPKGLTILRIWASVDFVSIFPIQIVDTVSLNRIWENEKMNQANGYHPSPDPYVGNQKALKIEKFHELIWRTLRFFLALSINYSFWGT